MPVDIQAWHDAGSKGPGTSGGRTLLQRDTFTDENGTQSYVELEVKANRTFNWSYTYYLNTKEGADPEVEQGTWTVGKDNWSRRAKTFAAIEAAYSAQESRLSTLTRKPQAPTSKVIREETHEGLNFTLEEVSGGFRPAGTTEWLLKITGFPDRNVAPIPYTSEAAAMAGFDAKVRLYTQDVRRQESRTFMDTQVLREVVFDNERESEPMEVYYDLPSGVGRLPAQRYAVGDAVGDAGTLTGDAEQDFNVFQAYISNVLTPAPAEPEERYEFVPVAFTGWEDAFSMENTPFGPSSKITDADVSGDQIYMEKNTGAFGIGANYSAVYLYIKEGYKVVFDVDAKGLEKAGPGDEDVSFEAQLMGGDAFVLDFVGRNAPTQLSVLINGEERTPYTPQDTAFEIVSAEATLRLINIFKRELVAEDEDVDDGRKTTDDDDEEGDVEDMDGTAFANLGVLAVAGVVLLLFIGVLARVGKKATGGAEEASE